MSDRAVTLTETRGPALTDTRVPAVPMRTGIVADWVGAAAPPAGIAERAVAIVAILALVGINVVGFFAALTLIAASLLLAALRPADSLRTLIRFSPLLALPLLAAISTLWSDAPAQTLKAGLEVILTAVAAIILCRNASARTLVLVMFAGLLPVCLWTLSAVPDALATGYPMKSFFGSKNELGVVAQLLFSLALAIMFDRSRTVVLRLLALASAGLAVGLMVLSQSATAMTCAVITAVIFPVLLLFGRLPRAARIGAVAVLIAAGGLALPATPQIIAEIEEVRGTVLKKDATLTGRTYLWDMAREISAERPALGHGYHAFWRPGNLDAEALWRWGGVPNKTGFNFHNAFIEMRVDLGWVGVAMLALTYAGVLLLGIARQVLQPSVAMAFLVTLVVVFVVRSYTEDGLFSPFSSILVLCYGCAIYALERGRAASKHSVGPEQQRGLRYVPRVLGGGVTGR